MAINANQSTRFIYIRSTKEKIPCTEQQFQDFYRMAGTIRKKEQYHHRCKCPEQYIWPCDGGCENCEHHLDYGTLSFDAPNTDDDGTLLDTELTGNASMKDVYADRALLEQLFQRLRELNPDADRFIALWAVNDKISDRGIAEALDLLHFAEEMAPKVAAAKAGINTYHGTAKRLMMTKHYLGDDFYPAIIDADIYEKAKEELTKRAPALGRLDKVTKGKDLTASTRFCFLDTEKHSDLPADHAESIYSWIECEVS